MLILLVVMCYNLTMKHKILNCKKCNVAFIPDKNGRLYCESCRNETNNKMMSQYIANHSGNCIVCNTKLRSLSAKRCPRCAKTLYTGKNSPHWKGGRFITQDGYCKIYNGNRKDYLWEHHLVWEKANGKKLPKGWIIHHLNGIRDDNRIENLVAVPSRKQHPTYTFVKALQTRIRELEQLHLPLS